MREYLIRSLKELDDQIKDAASRVLVCDEAQIDRARLNVAGLAGLVGAYETILNLDINTVNEALSNDEE